MECIHTCECFHLTYNEAVAFVRPLFSLGEGLVTERSSPNGIPSALSCISHSHNILPLISNSDCFRKVHFEDSTCEAT